MATAALDVARAFVQSFAGRVVAKPMASGAEVVMADDDFFEGWERQGFRPTLFQQYVKGRSLRCYTLGGAVDSMGQIHYDPRYVDWRERTEWVETTAQDETLREEIRRAVRLLELPYCGMDIEYDEHTGQHYFLDFNPSALFLGWSRLVQRDMPGRIADYLLQVVRRDGDPWLTVTG